MASVSSILELLHNNRLATISSSQELLISIKKVGKNYIETNPSNTELVSCLSEIFSLVEDYSFKLAKYIKNPFDGLPNVLLFHIFSNLSLEAMCSILSVCKRFSQFNLNEDLWKILALEKWKTEGLFERKNEILPPNCNWKWVAQCLLNKVKEGSSFTGKGFILEKKFYYIGEWENGAYSGAGLRTKADGYIYCGNWKQDLLEGKGVKIWPTGEKYEGDWINHKEDGFGTILWSEHAFYRGQWKNGHIDGQGVKEWVSGTKYTGEWINNKPHGHGVKKWVHGDSYEGEWFEGTMNGRGIYQWKSGSIYEGQWKDGNMDGEGTKTWADGAKYTGRWKNDSPHGFGTKIWKSGNKFQGEWLNGDFHGNGTYTWVSGDVHNGSWRDNLESGEGHYRSCFGSTFDGFYLSGQFHGIGTFTHPDGFSWTGNWLAGLPEKIEDATHPTLRKTLEGNSCTRETTRNAPFYGQVLSHCLTCDKGEPREKRVFLCESCMINCHEDHQAFTQKIWTVGRTFCQCTLCCSPLNCSNNNNNKQPLENLIEKFETRCSMNDSKAADPTSKSTLESAESDQDEHCH